jgi:hypothetical protein
MRRSTLATPLLLLTLTGCGGHTPAEQAYLAELQERGSLIELPDPDRDLTIGHDACDALADFKPEERELSAFLLEQHRPFTRMHVTAAVKHLCPELGVTRY